MKLKSILLLSSALLVFKASFAQYSVTTGGKKYVLLEEGTGTWCGYCPDGAEDIERSIEPNYPRAIVASFHNSDGMALSPDVFNSTYCGCSTCVGWPAATIDRNLFSGAVGKGRSWDGYIATDSGLTPSFDVTLLGTYNDTTSVLTITVKGKALSAQTGTFYINAYVKEDSISSATYPQDNYARPACGASCNAYWQFCAPPYDTSWFWMYGDPIVPATRYSHMNVVRKVCATGASIFGDVAFTNPAINDSFSKTYIDTIPATQVASRLKVIGLVQKYDAANVNDRPIENAIQSEVKLMPAKPPRNTTGVAVLASKTIMDIKLFPNPAQNSITVKGMLDNPTDTRIIIYNALGAVIVDRTYTAGGSLFAENIPLNNVSNGTYFMSVINNGQSVNKQFTVNK